jgi:hypothetical protein
MHNMLDIPVLSFTLLAGYCRRLIHAHLFVLALQSDACMLLYYLAFRKSVV